MVLKEDDRDGDPGMERDRDPDRTRSSVDRLQTLRLVVASVIVGVWALIYLRSFLDSQFHAPGELSAVMLAVVAWLFGSAALKGRD